MSWVVVAQLGGAPAGSAPPLQLPPPLQQANYVVSAFLVNSSSNLCTVATLWKKSRRFNCYFIRGEPAGATDDGRYPNFSRFSSSFHLKSNHAEELDVAAGRLALPRDIPIFTRVSCCLAELKSKSSSNLILSLWNRTKSVLPPNWKYPNSSPLSTNTSSPLVSTTLPTMVAPIQMTMTLPKSGDSTMTEVLLFREYTSTFSRTAMGLTV